jgi:hypothetical protein
MKICIIDPSSQIYTTVGYWIFTEPNNTGELIIEVSKMTDWRFEWAVIGHELIEAMFCWLFGITTEECDKFDGRCEREFASGDRCKSIEPGFDKECPYRIGHILGAAWEYAWIHLSLASWSEYDEECNRLMGITPSIF